MNGEILMEPFIRNDQYNFIKEKGEHLISAYANVQDQGVLKAVKMLAVEKAEAVFEKQLDEEQGPLIKELEAITDRKELEAYLDKIKANVFSFPSITDKTLKKLFPKNKKVKLPSQDEMENTLSYLAWEELGSSSKLLIVPIGERLIGLQGGFQPAEKKGVCAICRKFGKVGLFTSKIKGHGAGTFTKRGNYICSDSFECNQQIQSLAYLMEFVELMRTK
ncbi:FusB/FusC family EF-G-binding protein [Cytobacillus gottheilii]|uniref:FusB/FusC family EF-G-binding protein n=1 Tax=Cytobacillus gottheilii TaxID=859144 RepID=UPI0009BB7F55|nr:FusB/FusC family EF-G-binding protein [Cytobacillus gottheilii]